MAKINEKDFIEVNVTYGEGVAVDRYGAEYSLITARRNKDGEIWGVWCYPQAYRDGEWVPGQTAIPVHIVLGVKQQAIQRLEQLIAIVEGR